MSAKAEAKVEAKKMSPEELKAQLEAKAKIPHAKIEEHESPSVVQARTLAALSSGKAKENLEHLTDRPKGEGLTDAAKAAYLEDKKEKAAAKEAPKA